MRTRSLAILLAVSLAGCRKAAEEPAQPASAAAEKTAAPSAALAKVKEAEPNDTWQKAQLIAARAEVEGDFAPKKGKTDDDWYRVAPGAGQKLALQIDLLPAELDASVEVFDRDRNRLLRQRTARWLLCYEQCYIKVSGASGKYTLRVAGEAPSAAWELEPNDRAVDATPLKAGEPIRGYFGAPGDLDFYKLDLPPAQPGQFLRIELTGVAGVRAALDVRALDGALIAEARAAAEGEGLLIRDLSFAPPPPPPPPAASDAGAPDAGDQDAGASDAGVADAGAPPRAASREPQAGLFLVVKSGWLGRNHRGSNLKDAYTLTASLESGPADLEIEPNDDPQHATDLGPTLSRSGYLAPAGDEDWYRLRVAAPSILHVEVSGLERADLELSVYGPPAKPGEKPQLLARANEGGLKEGEVLPAVGLPAGDSFIKIESASRVIDGKRARDTFDEKQLYKLTATLSPDDGTTEKEPNDAQHPQQLALPATVRGFIWPRKDVDVFQFHVPEGHPPITIKVSAVRGVDLQLVLRQLTGPSQTEIIGTADAVKGEGEESIVAVPVKPGDYTIEVSSPRNADASATQPYTLTVQ